MSDRDQIVAAGGLVVERGTGRVLLVHRLRYDDWSFPKGKALPGETLEQTAHREVREETGLQCRIIRPVATVNYDYRTRKGLLRPKVVHYYLMEPEPIEAALAGLNPDGVEVDKLEWLTPDEADLKLSYQVDKGVLRQLLSHQDEDADKDR
jgi:8-oxo-dGTP diphosphatase